MKLNAAAATAVRLHFECLKRAGIRLVNVINLKIETEISSLKCKFGCTHTEAGQVLQKKENSAPHLFSKWQTVKFGALLWITVHSKLNVGEMGEMGGISRIY